MSSDLLIKNDGTSLYLQATASANQYGSNSALRPFFFNLSTGAVNIDASGAGSTFGGSIAASGAISSSLGLSGTTGTFSSTVGINSGTSLPLNLTTSSTSPYHVTLTRSDLSSSSSVYNDNGSRWYFQHRPNFGGNTPLDSGNYNSYSPTLGGTGASGNWNINSVNITQYTINQNLGTEIGRAHV